MKLSDMASGDPKYWVSGTTYAVGKTVRSPSDHQRYARITAGAGTTDPASDSTNWRPDGGRPIKSTQRGAITIAYQTNIASVTISAVNPAKSQLRWLGGSGAEWNTGNAVGLAVQLVNSTTVQAVASSIVASASSAYWELTEYY